MEFSHKKSTVLGQTMLFPIQAICYEQTQVILYYHIATMSIKKLRCRKKCRKTPELLKRCAYIILLSHFSVNIFEQKNNSLKAASLSYPPRVLKSIELYQGNNIGRFDYFQSATKSIKSPLFRISSFHFLDYFGCLLVFIKK